MDLDRANPPQIVYSCCWLRYEKPRVKVIQYQLHFVTLQRRMIRSIESYSLGFGGRVKALIQSMSYNDCVRVRIAGSLPAPLWFTKGV